MAAGKNALINGAFDIWQRGTTFTNPSTGSPGTYTADRWTVYFNGNGTVTQETSVKPDTSTYALKVTATASSAGNDVYQLVEQLNMEQFRGKVVTLSVKVAGTATVAPGLGLAYSTTANDTLTNTSTGIGATIVANPTINASTFVTYISQFTVPTTAKTLRIQLGSAAMANTNVLYWAEAQLEIGSTATVFSRAGGTIQGELSACMRYYYRAVTGAAYGQLGGNPAYSVSTVSPAISFPVVMRTVPTSANTAGLTSFILENNSAISANNFTTIALNASATTSQIGVIDITKTSAFTTGVYYKLIGNNSSTAWVEFSAEL
jgi:hypothetical protein